jgi:hypothetical protein
MQDFVERHGLTFPQGNDDAGAVFAHFGVPYQPAWAFVSADGDVETVNGALEDDELTAKLDALAVT